MGRVDERDMFGSPYDLEVDCGGSMDICRVEPDAG